jgi:predicted RNase H-like HicB family nuclease
METFTAIIDKEEEMYVAKCAEIGTVSQGKTIEEALDNLKEATELYLEEFPVKRKIHPLLTTFEISIVRSQNVNA